MKPVDMYLLYSFIRRLSTPFENWRMYDVGLINADGDFIVPVEQRTAEQKASYSYFDVLILNLKRIMAKVPGGSTRIATFAAALFLLKERHPVSESAVERLTAKFLAEEGEGAPVNNMGGGAIADTKKGLKYKPEALLKRKKVNADVSRTPST